MTGEANLVAAFLTLRRALKAAAQIMPGGDPVVFVDGQLVHVNRAVPDALRTTDEDEASVLAVPNRESPVTDRHTDARERGGYWDGWADGVESVRTVGEQAVRERDAAQARAENFRMQAQGWKQEAEQEKARADALEMALRELLSQAVGACLNYSPMEDAIADARAALAASTSPARATPCPHCGTMLTPLPKWTGVKGVLCPECGKDTRMAPAADNSSNQRAANLEGLCQCSREWEDIGRACPKCGRLGASQAARGRK